MAVPHLEFGVCSRYQGATLEVRAVGGLALGHPSIGSNWALVMIHRSVATSLASLFYLVPATIALTAYVLFGERLDGLAIAGMTACAAAVFLADRRTADGRTDA